MPHVVDQRSAVAPLVDQVLQGLLAVAHDAAIVHDLEPAVLADVAEVRGDGRHASTATRDLDHHLRCATRYGGLDALADHGSFATGHRVQAQRRRRLDDAAGGVEETLAPLHKDAIDGWAGGHGDLLADLSSATSSAANAR